MSESTNHVELAAEIVSAYVSNNSVPSSELPALLSDVHAAIVRVATGAQPVVVEAAKPAVPPKKSITSDYVICLEDGRKFKSLKRHLRTQFNLSPEDIARNGVFRPTIPWSLRLTPRRGRRWRSRWGLDNDGGGASQPGGRRSTTLTELDFVNPAEAEDFRALIWERGGRRVGGTSLGGGLRRSWDGSVTRRGGVCARSLWRG